MKKSEYTITMPILDYEQFIQYKEKYEKLVQSLKDCYDTNTHDKFPQEPIRFDPKKAEKLSREFLSIKYKNTPIIIQ